MYECVTKFKTCAEQKHSFLFNNEEIILKLVIVTVYITITKN